ncbi:MAG: hypothetical protein ACHQET_08870 [Chitinophagales bacterium]
MKKFLIAGMISIAMVGCQSDESVKKSETAGNEPLKDTLSYPYKASYSSDFTVPGRADYAHLTLKVWKFFENLQIDSLDPYFADSVVYQDATGMNFHGPKQKLFEFAKKDVESLDSLRFDINAWQSIHVNDKNDDWVDIWAVERVYPKKGKADTSWVQENWQIKNGKVVYFNQFKARPAR